MGDDALRGVVPLAQQNPYVAVDIETDGLASESYTVKAIIVSTDTHACVLDGFNPRHVGAALDALDAASVLAFHNSPFDVPPLVHSGAMRIDHIDKVIDTLPIARMAYTDSIAGRGLEQLEKRLLRTADNQAHKDRLKTWAKINRVSVKEMWKKISYNDTIYPMYAGWDGILTHRLVSPLLAAAQHQLTDHPFGRYGADQAQASYLVGREQRVNRVMLRRSARGLAVDPEGLSREQQRLMEVQSDLEQTLLEHQINSATNPGELIAALERDHAIPEDYPRTPKQQRPSTKGDDLELLDHPAAVAYVAYGDNNRLMNSLESSRKIAERTDGRLHPSVGIMKAVTGRMSYGSPALQGFGEWARLMVLADAGDDMTSIDWSQIEPVLTANLANDHKALEVYESEFGGDLYSVAAEAASVSRKHAKIIILAMLYGEGLTALATDLRISNEEAALIRSKVASAIPLTDRLTRWAVEWARITGKTWTLSGRIVDVDPMRLWCGPNYTIQGSSYDLLAETIVEMDNRGIADLLYLAMHDELIVSSSVAGEVEEIMRTPSERMIELFGRTPLLRVDSSRLGDRWRTPGPCARCGGEKEINWSDGWLCKSCSN